MQHQNDDNPPEVKLEADKRGGSGGGKGTAVGADGDDASASQPAGDEGSVFDMAIHVMEEVFLKKHGGANWQQAWTEAEECAKQAAGGQVELDILAAAIDQVISSYTVQEFTDCGVDELCIMYPFIERMYLSRICKLVSVYGKHNKSKMA